MNDFSKYHLSNGAKIKTSAIPGHRSRELLELQSQIEGSIVSYPKSFPIAIKRAHGAIIEDVDENFFIDFFSSAGVVNLGHCNQDVTRFITDQQQQLIHALDFPTELKMEVIQSILSNLPSNMSGEYKVNFVGPSGSDAVEAALKLVKMKTGRENIIAFTGSYHGMTANALSITSDTRFRNKFSLGTQNVHFVPYSYCYRCPFKRKPDDCTFDCVEYLENILTNEHSGITKPAAIILEPVQGEGGNVVPKPGFLERIVALANKHGVLTIFDEIQSGFFRTGKFCSFMNSNAQPDIILLSKGLGGVGLPISAIVYKKSIEAWGAGDHVGTFRGNQASLAGAKGAFEFVKRNALMDHVSEISLLLMAELKKLQDRFPVIGEIRGSGLMIGIEFVSDNKSKLPCNKTAERVRKNCFEKGLIIELGGHYKNVLRILPPLITTPQIIMSAIKILTESMELSTLEN